VNLANTTLSTVASRIVSLGCGADANAAVAMPNASPPPPPQPVSLSIPAPVAMTEMVTPAAAVMLPPPQTQTVTVSTDDALVSRILYPDLSILAEGGGGGGAGSGGGNITMYAVAPPTQVVQGQVAPAAAAAMAVGQPHYQIVSGGGQTLSVMSAPPAAAAPPPPLVTGSNANLIKTAGVGGVDYQHPADYYCHDCDLIFSNANAFLEHISHGHQEPQNVLQVVSSDQVHLASQPQDLTTTTDQQQAVVQHHHQGALVGKLLRCNICSALCHDKKSLVDHIQMAHAQTAPPTLPAVVSATAPPSVTMQPRMVITAADGTTHLVPAPTAPAAAPQTLIQPVQIHHHQEVLQEVGVPAAAAATMSAAAVTSQQPQQPQLPAPLMGSGDSLFCPDCKNPFANKYSLMKHLRSTKCRHESEVVINKIINDQLTCGKCLRQFGSIQALKKHLEANKCVAVVAQEFITVPSGMAGSTIVDLQQQQQEMEAAAAAQQSAAQQQLSPPSASAKPSSKGLVYDESVHLLPDATVQVYKCPEANCAKPCVTLRAFKMHAKCLHKSTELEPLVQDVKANFICKVRGCGKLFVEESQLDVHAKHHENYTPRTGKHKCTICGEAFYQKDMLKKHVLSTHNQVTAFKSRMSKKKKMQLQQLQQQNTAAAVTTAAHVTTTQLPSFATTAAPSAPQQQQLPSPDKSEIKLKYDPELRLAPGTMMTIYNCPVDGCNKRSCTDMKSFKLHCLHIHRSKDILPIVEEVEARFICQVENCGKLYLERKQFDIHQRHHKSYVPSKGRYFKCQHCDSKFNTQGNLDVHVIQSHMASSGGGGGDDPSAPGGGGGGETGARTELIFEDITLEPGTLMQVYHCPVAECGKRNYLDGKSVRTHCRRVHGMIDYEGFPSQAEAQFVCQVRGCRKLFMEQVQIEAHLKHHRNYVPTNGVFECKVCPQTFSRKEHLDKHILTNHTVSGFSELHPSAQLVSFDGQKYNIKHVVGGPTAMSMTSQQPTTVVTSSVDASATAESEVAPSNVPPTNSNGKVMGYQCSICMRKFLHLGTHCTHVAKFHQAPGMAPLEVEIKPRYTCKFARCGRHFMTKNMFKAHTDRHAANGKNKRAMDCFKCGRNFSQFKSLYQHLIQTHADVTPEEIAKLEADHAKCPICHAVFRSADIMRVHMRRHSSSNHAEAGHVALTAVASSASGGENMTTVVQQIPDAEMTVVTAVKDVANDDGN